ncbi:hemocyanin 1, partial [Biomphalaria glabrata]
MLKSECNAKLFDGSRGQAMTSIHRAVRIFFCHVSLPGCICFPRKMWPGALSAGRPSGMFRINKLDE